MCYFLYGSLYGDVSESEYVDVKNKYGLKISLGTKHDIKSAVRAAAEFVQDDFRITDWICDCDSPVGKHDPTEPTIIELSNLITELSALPGAKQINICKTWTGKQNKREIKINLGETDLPTFLADLQENILYCLNISYLQNRTDLALNNFFVSKDWAFGLYGHPWQKELIVVGEELISAIEKKRSELDLK